MAVMYREISSWTLIGLVGAFFNLMVAYVLLSISACMFVPSKILNFLCLRFPCPCTGIFGFQNSDYCWHSLLVDFPIRIISYVLELAKNRFPFEFIFLRDHSLSDVHGSEDCVKFRSVDRGSGFEIKGKRIANQNNKRLLRRRVRGNLNLLSHAMFPAGDVVVPCYVSDSLEEPCKSIENGNSVCEHDVEQHKEDDLYCKKLTNERLPCDDEEAASEIHERCRMLEDALMEEKSACSAVCLELDKERAAAASAADEAMGMILRLHEEKAMIELEARHYQRLIEEKFAYEEEEMNTLKEILIKREKENHCLQKELENYREIGILSVKELVEDKNDHRKNVGMTPSVVNLTVGHGRKLCSTKDLNFSGEQQNDCSFFSKEGDSEQGESPVHDIHVIDYKILK